MNQIVEMIRVKTEEEDLDQILKTSMGGYTKKSVRDYLASVRRQQQEMADTFNRNLQSTLDEKDALQKELEAVRNRLEKAQSDYRGLSDTLTASAGADGGETLVQLKNENAVLSKDMDEAIVRIQSDEQKIAHLEETLAARERELEQEQTQTNLLREQLSGERASSAELNRTVSAQSAGITRLQDEITYLQGIVSEGNVGKLNTQIDSLMESARLQKKLMEAKDQELTDKAARIAQLEERSAEQRAAGEKLQELLTAQMLRCEKLEEIEKTLSEQLQEAADQRLELLRVQSSLRVEKAQLMRRLDAVNLQKELESVVGTEEK